MKTRLQKGFFVGIVLLIVILFFAIFDHALHGLSDRWSVPDFYFKDKIPFGFLWGVVGLFLVQKLKNIWLKALIFSSVIAITLQVRYFIQGYNLSFVLIFLLFHFIILYVLSIGMFMIFNKYILTNKNMGKIIIAIVVLVLVAAGAYYLVFGNNQNQAPLPSDQNTTVSTPATQTPTEPTTSTSTTPKTTKTPAATNVTVVIKNFAFSPASLTIKAGTKVTWINNDVAPHTVTSDSGNLLNSPTIAPGQSFSFTFNNISTTNYHCKIHPMMKASVTVN